MSLQRLNRSVELKRLRDENYDVALLNGYLALRGVPFLSANGVTGRGWLIVAELSMAGDVVTTPTNHEMYWVGDLPHGLGGQSLGLGAREVQGPEIAPGTRATYRFSFKLDTNLAHYDDYYQMFTAYYARITGPAVATDSSLETRELGPYAPEDEESVFNYIDTATSRAGIPEATSRLEKGNVAVVGLGGTGSYILDGISKLPIRAIHLFDGDKLLTHNAFRSPGAPTLAELESAPSKVSYFASKYAAMHRNIIPREEAISQANIQLLREMDYVFVAIDSGPARKLVVDHLEAWGKPFVDVGMGLILTEGLAIAGLVRTTSFAPGRESVFDRYADYSEGNGDLYKRNIQTADLNMLNAALAIVNFKKSCGFYFDDEHGLHSNYVVTGNAIINAMS